MNWLFWLSFLIAVFSVVCLIAAVALDSCTRGETWFGFDRPLLIDLLFSCFLGGTVGNTVWVLVMGGLSFAGVA